MYPHFVSRKFEAMKLQTTDTTGDTKIPKQLRNAKLSKDGKWKAFPKVPHLLQYISTGTYFARVKVNGKVIRQSLETDVYTTAIIKLPDFLKKHRSKKAVDGNPVTFADARKLYTSKLESSASLSDQSKRYRKYCLKKLAESWPELDGLKLGRIGQAACEEWAGKLARKIDAQYFNNVLGTMRLILRRGGIVEAEDPTRGIERQGIDLTPPALPSKEQFREILTQIETSGAGQQQHCADFARFLAYSGCRLSEARKVTWADVNLVKGVITVHNAKVRRKKDYIPTREVPIIPEMRTLLERLALEPHKQTDRVCVVGECEKALVRACKLVGVPRLTHHDLRHLFATRCIEAGVDIPTVSSWMGHSDGGALLMKVYRHLRNEHSVAMAEKVSF